MSRTFAATNNITLGIGGSGVKPITVAAIVNKTNDANTNLFFRTGNTNGHQFGVAASSLSNKLWYNCDPAGDLYATSLTYVLSEGWALLAYSKASGTTTPRFHKYVYGTNTHSHDNGTGNIADPTTLNTNCWLGGSPGTWRGDIAACGVWNVVLTDAQIESLPFSLAAWFQVSPVGLWLLDQQTTGQKVMDQTGNGANESSISGTTVSTLSVPIFGYGLPTRRLSRQPAAAVGGAAGPRDLLLLRAG